MTEWPTVGPDFNQWYSGFDEFTRILNENKDIPYWTYDFALKYLNIRIDTRKNSFLVLIDGKERISPNRIIEAIDRFKSS